MLDEFGPKVAGRCTSRFFSKLILIKDAQDRKARSSMWVIQFSLRSISVIRVIPVKLSVPSSEIIFLRSPRMVMPVERPEEISVSCWEPRSYTEQAQNCKPQTSHCYIPFACQPRNIARRYWWFQVFVLKQKSEGLHGIQRKWMVNGRFATWRH